MISHPEPDKITSIHCRGGIGDHVHSSSSDLFSDDDVMKSAKMASPYTILDVNVKNRKSVVDSVGIFRNYKGPSKTLKLYISSFSFTIKG